LAELDVTRLIVHGPFDVAAMLPSGATSVAEVNDVAVWAVPTYGPVFLTDGTSPDGLRLRRQAARPERLVVEVPPTIAGQTVVVSEAFSPGWSASEGIGLHRYHDLLMAFTAPAGGGEVALRYRTPGLRLGTLLSGLALIVLIAGFVRSRQGSAAARDGPKASSTLES
jgi:hypothetical protein